MAMTSVDHLTLTVSTVKVFKETMQFLNEYDLWDDAQAYLEEKGKTEMFVDCEVLFYVHEMLMQDPRIDSDHKAIGPFVHHLAHFNHEQTS